MTPAVGSTTRSKRPNAARSTCLSLAADLLEGFWRRSCWPWRRPGHWARCRPRRSPMLPATRPTRAASRRTRPIASWWSRPVRTGCPSTSKTYRWGESAHAPHRIVVLEAGPLGLPEHIQNLPVGLGLGFPNFPDELVSPAVNRPWTGNVNFPGLAFVVGGRSLFWGGWSPELIDSELTRW